VEHELKARSVPIPFFRRKRKIISTLARQFAWQDRAQELRTDVEDLIIANTSLRDTLTSALQKAGVHIDWKKRTVRNSRALLAEDKLKSYTMYNGQPRRFTNYEQRDHIRKLADRMTDAENKFYREHWTKKEAEARATKLQNEMNEARACLVQVDDYLATVWGCCKDGNHRAALAKLVEQNIRIANDPTVSKEAAERKIAFDMQEAEIAKLNAEIAKLNDERRAGIPWNPVTVLPTFVRRGDYEVSEKILVLHTCGDSGIAQMVRDCRNGEVWFTHFPGADVKYWAYIDKSGTDKIG
jgi:hypothetical protein